MPKSGRTNPRVRHDIRMAAAKKKEHERFLQLVKRVGDLTNTVKELTEIVEVAVKNVDTLIRITKKISGVKG